MQFQTITARHNLMFLCALAVFRLALAAIAPLTPQEAYYWGWSQYLSWSYFDHPPLAAYSIAVTTYFFGDTVFGVKLSAVVWSIASNLLLARLVMDMFADRRLVLFSLLGLNLSLLYSFFSIVITPDDPLLFGWIGTIWAVWRVRQTGRASWWWLAGLFMGISWMGKYVGVLLVGVVGAYLLLDPLMRRWLLKPQPYLASLIAVLIFSPILWWNMQHDWVSLAFQSTRRLGQMNEIKPRFFVLLLVTQTLLLTPYLIWISLRAGQRNIASLFKGKIESAHLLLLVSALVPLLLFTLASFRSNAKINYLLPAWWSLLVLGMQWTLMHEQGLRKMMLGLASSAVLLSLSLAMLMLPNLPLGELNTWSGWRQAAIRVDSITDAVSREGKESFVFSPNYKISSLIWFYRPSKQRTHAQDITGKRALQFDYFPKSRSLQGQTGIFVVSDQDQSKADIQQIGQLFDTMHLADVVKTEMNGQTVRKIEIWIGQNYKGPPHQTESTGNPDSP